MDALISLLSPEQYCGILAFLQQPPGAPKLDEFSSASLFVFSTLQTVIFLMLIRFMDLYEREPLSILALMFVWGAVGSTAFTIAINRAILSSLFPGEVLGTVVNAPLSEETAKGLALVVAFALSYLVAKRFGVMQFNGLTDGLVYGAAVGLGFSFAEDIVYFFRFTLLEGNLDAGLYVYSERVDLLGWGQLGHATFTGMFGAGLGLATWSRSFAGRVGYPLLGFASAVGFHAINNGLAVLGAIGAVNFFRFVFVVVFLAAIVLWLRYQRQVIRFELGEEVNTGLISQAEWDIIPRYWRRSRWYWQVLLSGKLEQWRALRRVHNELVDLAFLKWRLRRQGGDWGQVERLRRRIYNLKTQEVVEQVLISHSQTSPTANTAAAGAAVDATITNAPATDPATSSSPVDTGGAQPTEPQARYCTNCGAELSPSARFCTSCGARVAL